MKMFRCTLFDEKDVLIGNAKFAWPPHRGDLVSYEDKQYLVVGREHVFVESDVEDPVVYLIVRDKRNSYRI